MIKTANQKISLFKHVKLKVNENTNETLLFLFFFVVLILKNKKIIFNRYKTNFKNQNLAMFRLGQNFAGQVLWLDQYKNLAKPDLAQPILF